MKPKIFFISSTILTMKFDHKSRLKAYASFPIMKKKKRNWNMCTFFNKSFSYQDTPPLRSLLVCILNFDNKTRKIFSKCNHLFGRYLGETHFAHKSRAVTRLKNKEKQNVNV